MEDEDMTCPLCKHEMSHQHMQILGVCGYFDWWECDWCGYATEEQEHIFTAKDKQCQPNSSMRE